MPPRHPQQGRGRTRAGTVPVPSGSSSSLQPPVDFPRARERMDSGVTSAFGAEPQPGAPHGLEHEVHGEQAMFEPGPESDAGSHEHEREDRLGLLSNSPSAGPSPRPSLSALRQRASNISLGGHRRGYSQSRTHSSSGSGSGSGVHSRTQSSHSGSSRSRAGSISVSVVRSRTQSLLQGLGAASQSSIELVQRLRANSSMARLEEDNSDARTTTNTHSRSGSGTTSDMMPSSGGENNTFGHPLRTTWHDAPQGQQQHREQPTPVEEEGSEEGREAEGEANERGRLHPAQSRTSVFSAPSSVFSSPSVATATEHQPSRAPSAERLQAESAGIPIPLVRAPQNLGLSSPSSYGDAATGSSSYPDISTAPQSFVTAPATVEGSTTESSGGRTDGLDSWGVAAGVAHMRDPSRGGHGQGAWGHPGPA
ncbi:OPT oligopeptide transporter [Mycena venus]|uniref:OPT oligopeptide transporter n=1 Tax=Mycena venus TaxID=2733690 RepID=A0A8H6WTX8_9AGAR|nr:OPT oligopeptide transporter [Mycena venus]